ncbi:MAG: DoxX family protein [Bacteroidota bacterium]
MTLRALLVGSGDTSTTTDLGLLILRLGIGLPMAFAHGTGKVPPSAGFIEATAGMGFPLPVLFAWAAGLSELVGGLLIAAGLATRPSAFFLAITMAVAFFVRHGNDPFADGELAFVYLVGALGLMVTGAGKYSIDAVFRRREPGTFR